MSELFVKRSASFSTCRKYRYTLKIIWDASLPAAVFIGLNPSTADEVIDDNTIRRCRGFAKSWGCGGIVMLNLFAFRATLPADMRAQSDPIGRDNNMHICMAVIAAEGPIVACWGTHGKHLERGKAVSRFVNDMQCLGRNADGTPKHPLYLAASTPLQPYSEVTS